MRFCAAVLLLLISISTCLAQSGGAVAPIEPKFRVVRGVSGSKGSQVAGKYAIEDPRTTFYLPADKKIIAYFEWEGPIGKHHFEASWKNPEGRVVVISDFDYEAKQRRFAGYWQLDLNESMAPGMWSVEARIDGELTGSQNLQIIAADKPASAEVTRKLLEPAEIYQRILKASVFIDKLDNNGKGKGTGSGFFLDEKRLVTAFQNIDGAGKVRIRMPDGTHFETDQVLAWNRLQDWAVLPVSTAVAAKLPRAEPGLSTVGDRCFTLDVQAEESRLIIDENITGMNNFPLVGKRLNLSYLPTATAIGSPVVNQYGEVIGVSGGTIYPGMPSRFETMNVSTFKLQQSAMATPMEMVSVPDESTVAKSFDELAGMGQFVQFLSEDPDLLYGLLAPKFDTKAGTIPGSMQVKSEISAKEGTCSILLVWSPKSKSRSQIFLRLYDLTNKALVMSKPADVKLNPGSMLSSVWTLPVDKLPLSVYRIDAFRGEKPFWRGYFKLTD